MKAFASKEQLAYSYARKMNESASLLVMARQYDRALSSLTKALRISQSHIQIKSKEDWCSCRRCSFDESICFSENRQPLHQNMVYAENLNEANIHRRHRKRRRQRMERDASHKDEDGCRENDGSDSNDEKVPNRNNLCGHSCRDKYEGRHIDSSANETRVTERNEYLQTPSFMVHTHLIQVPELSFQKGCESIGSIAISNLSIVTIFNLALVHHLKAMNDGIHFEDSTGGMIHKAIDLYHVVLNALKNAKKEQYDRNGSSPSYNETYLQLQILLSNNISHAYQLAGNKVHHEGFLQELLSTLMMLTDLKSRQPITDQRVIRGLDLEGFLANVAPLVSSTQCADAA